MSAQCSLSASVMLLHHSNLRIGAESKADNKAKYELKLLCLRNHFMILINLSPSLSRSLGSSCCRILVLHQKLMLLKCSVNLVKLGDLSSFCSCTQRINSAESSRKNSWASNRVICSASSTDLKLSRLYGLLGVARPLVLRSGNNLDLLSSNFWINLVRSAFARINSPSETNSAIKSVRSSIT